MGYILRKRFRFEASHTLVGHDGKCARLHGHSWHFTVECRAPKVRKDGPKEGMVVDFSDISKEVKPLLETYLDHWHLNETLSMLRPTSERIAAWIFDSLYGKIEGLWAVEVEETCTSSCRYSPYEHDSPESF